ncbi:unnamed protein product [Acanthosepion pharaonis]|uniref:Uncharacterized protein n=1 Tax=Acanthosepion pharaonis TaxID=158019 RepID=A0A812C1D7_ACAPH|nr:unnamed protein product [Sepia pharaonis]
MYLSPSFDLSFLSPLFCLPGDFSPFFQYLQNLKHLPVFLALSNSPLLPCLPETCYSVVLSWRNVLLPSLLEILSGIIPLFCLPGTCSFIVPFSLIFWNTLLIILFLENPNTVALSPLFCLPGEMYQQSPFIVLLICRIKHSSHYSVFLEECTNSPLRIPVDFRMALSPLFCLPGGNVLPFVSLLICRIETLPFSFLEECTNSPLHLPCCLPSGILAHYSSSHSLDPLTLSSWRNYTNSPFPSSLFFFCHYSPGECTKIPFILFSRIHSPHYSVPVVVHRIPVDLQNTETSPHYSVFLEECTKVPFNTEGIISHYSVFLGNLFPLLLISPQSLRSVFDLSPSLPVDWHYPHYSVFLEECSPLHCPFDLQNTISPIILSSWRRLPVTPCVPVDFGTLPIILSSWRFFTNSPLRIPVDLQNTEALSPLFCLPGTCTNSPLRIPVDLQNVLALSHYSVFLEECTNSPLLILKHSPHYSVFLEECTNSPLRIPVDLQNTEALSPLFCLPGGMYQQSPSILKHSPHYSVFLEECTNNSPFKSLLICRILKHSPHYSVFLEECTNSPLVSLLICRILALSPLFCLPGGMYQQSLHIPVDLQNTEALSHYSVFLEECTNSPLRIPVDLQNAESTLPIILSSWRNVNSPFVSLQNPSPHYSVFLEECIPSSPCTSHYSVFLEECTNSPLRIPLICRILKHSPHYSVFLEECTNSPLRIPVDLQNPLSPLILSSWRNLLLLPLISRILTLLILSSWRNVATVPFPPFAEYFLPIILSSWRNSNSPLHPFDSESSFSPIILFPGVCTNSPLRIPVDFLNPHYSVF